jgi:hypothetical protein
MEAVQINKIIFVSSKFLASKLKKVSILGRAIVCFPKSILLLAMSLASPMIPVS